MSKYGRKIAAYILILYSVWFVGALTLALFAIFVATLNLTFLTRFLAPAVIASQLVGVIILFYYFIMFVIFLYKWARYRLDLNPEGQEATRLQYLDGSFAEVGGIELDTAKSIFYAAFGALWGVLWTIGLDLLVKYLPTFSLFRDVVNNLNNEKISTTVTILANFATGSNTETLIQTFTFADYLLIVKYLPAFLLGYIVFRHTVFLIEKSLSSEDPLTEGWSELRGLSIYAWMGLRDLLGQAGFRGVIKKGLDVAAFVFITYWYFVMAGIFLSNI